jgi:predicted phage terminase large subunit-like protein
MKMTEAEYLELLRTDFLSYLQWAFYELNPESNLLLAPYIELMAAKLEACRLGKIRRLIINLPPRYLKSHCASISLPTWLLGHSPGTKIICASYGQDLANNLALESRKIMMSPMYQYIFGTRLSQDKRALDDFKTTMNGGRMATSVGGALTGMGGEFLIIDDPMKPDEALSDVQRTKCIAWFENTLRSRLNEKIDGCIIIIMQRLHQNDLAGHLIEQGGWEVLSFPAIAETDELHIIEHSRMTHRVFTRQAGEALHPERETREMLEKTRELIGNYNFSSQYQQNPIPKEGLMVKSEWLQYYDELPESSQISTVIQSWDTAVKSGAMNDFSVCTTWAVTRKGHYYLIHVYRKKLQYPELRRAVIELCNQHKPRHVLIEDKSSGSQLIQDLEKELGSKIKAFTPLAGTTKAERLNSITDLFEAGKVFFPKKAHWLHDYRSELTSFPGAKHDDQVDSTSQALTHLKNSNSSLATWEKLGRRAQ